MDAAIKHCTKGIGIWEWASNDNGYEPDLVMASAGDIPTKEALAATARAVATALHERPQLLAYRPRGESELRREAERELQRLTGGVIGHEEPSRDGFESRMACHARP